MAALQPSQNSTPLVAASARQGWIWRQSSSNQLKAGKASTSSYSGCPNGGEPNQRSVNAFDRECLEVFPCRSIHLAAELRNRQLTLSVADRGPGIDDFEQSLIFDKFYRGRDQRTRIQGTGMGLAIAKAIVEAHGGSIGVTSQLGHGSGFFFTLPAVQPSTCPPSYTSEQRARRMRCQRRANLSRAQMPLWKKLPVPRASQSEKECPAE
jgi:hypothetical protein